MLVGEAKTVSGAVNEIGVKVGTEGLEIILAVIAGMGVLITVIILIPRLRQFISKLAGQ